MFIFDMASPQCRVFCFINKFFLHTEELSLVIMPVLFGFRISSCKGGVKWKKLLDMGTFITLF